MDQETNRFIFSDAFYDKLVDNIPEEKPVVFDAVKMPPMIDEKKENVTVVESNNNQDTNDSGTDDNYYFDFFNRDDNKQEFVLEDENKKEEVPSFSSSSLDVDISNFDYNQQVKDNNLVNNENEKIGLSDFSFDNKEELPISNSNDINIIENDPILVEDNEIQNYEFNPSSNFSLNINNSNNLDVETGINTDLENEIMMPRVEKKIPIVENTIDNWNHQDSGEKMVYRAKRNNVPNSFSNIQNTLKTDDDSPRKIDVPVTEFEKIQEFKLTDNEINPQVINIDDLLMNETKSEDIMPVNVTIDDEIDTSVPAVKSDLLNRLIRSSVENGKFSILARYGEDFCSRDYVTNPAIGRNEEIKQLILILLTPEKSGILVGKPGIGKTSIVEGLAYRLQRNQVPDALKGYTIISVKATSLIGTLPTGEARLQTLIDELKNLDKVILFMDEIHMLMGATSESSLDFANMFKESLGRGSIKMLGATTSDEYERYVLRDKAFVRRFQRVDVEEPSREHTISIMMGSLPKIEHSTGAKLKYSEYIKTEIMTFIVDITTEYKRVYGIGSRYPDICLTLLSQAFSQAVFDNRKEVNIFDIRNAIENSKNIYPDVIRKELINFDQKFKQIIDEEKAI